MNDANGAEYATPAERSLHGALEPVRAEPPHTPDDLQARVAKTLRWQSVVIVPVRAALVLAGGAFEAARALLGPRRSG